MKDKGKGTSEHSRPATAAGTEIFDQAMKSYEQTVRTGVKLQEDTAKWWTNFFQQATQTQELQRQMSSIVSQAIPTAQRSMEESLRLIDQGSKTTLNLLKKTMDGSCATAASDVQSEVQQLWQSSLNVIQSNLQSINESQTKAMESWTELMRKGAASAASTASATSK